MESSIHAVRGSVRTVRAPCGRCPVSEVVPALEPSAATVISCGHGERPESPNPFLIDSTLVLNGIAAGYRRRGVGYDQSLFWRVDRPGAALSPRRVKIFRELRQTAAVPSGGARPRWPARAAGSRPAQIVTAARSPGTARVGLRWSRPADDAPPGGAISLVPLGGFACHGCALGAARLPFGCLFGLRDLFCLLRCMVTLGLHVGCHYKSRPSGVNPDS
jgi:hypothetical protein